MRTVLTLLLLASVAQPLRAQSAACADTTRRAIPVHIPVDLLSNHFVITVCRGERPLSFVLDTGAPTSLFDLTIAKELGIETGRATRAGGAGAGTVAGAVLRLDSVRLAGTDVVVPIAMALDFHALNARGRLRIDGILGADFIERYVVGLDYRAKVLHLYDARTFAYTGAGSVVPFTMTNRFIYVRGDIGLPDGSRIPGRFVVDVGASGALSLAKPFVEANHLRDRVGTTVRREGGRGVGGVSMADAARVPTMSIGDVTIKQPIVMLYGDSAGVFSSSTFGDGNVGGDVLRRFTVLLDYPRQRMIFEPHAGTDEPFEIDMTGLTLVPVPGASALVVESVVRASPAARSGFAAGDTVVAIDGRPATIAELDSMRPRFLREGEQLAYTVRRRGTDVILRLVTRRMI
jgi:hypothetical protein